MKYFICLFVSLAAFADHTINVTAFYRISNDNSNRAAEICGTVSEVSSPMGIRIITDKGTRVERNFNTIIGKDGKFCEVISMYGTHADLYSFDLVSGEISSTSSVNLK